MGSKLTETGVTFGSNSVEQVKPLRKVDGVEPDSQGNIEVPLTENLEERVTILEDLIDPNQEKIYNVFQKRAIITTTYMRENANGDVQDLIAANAILGHWSMTLPPRTPLVNDPAYNKPYFVKIQVTGSASFKQYLLNSNDNILSESDANDLLAGGGTLVWWGLIPSGWIIDVHMYKDPYHGKIGYVPEAGGTLVATDNAFTTIWPTMVSLRSSSSLRNFDVKYLKAANGAKVNMGIIQSHQPSVTGRVGGRTEHDPYLDPDNPELNGDGISNPKGLKIKSFWGYSPNGPVDIQQGEYINNTYDGEIWGNAWNYFDPSTWYANMDVLPSSNYLDFPSPSYVSDGYGKVPINSGVPADDRHSPPNGEGVVVIEWIPIGE